ncbi:MAG: hypothetical protein Q4G16_11680 [Cruoricaptor ignavus]|nr:hypothetical protein [Cruoricaptor ignavus]
MKKLLLLGLFSLILISCKDRTEDDRNSFCNIERAYATDITDKTGTLIYDEEKAKFAIKYYPIDNTIDDVHYYFLCEKPENIDVNTFVIFSGKLYNFNSNENFNPNVGGTEYYFIKTTKINAL